MLIKSLLIRTKHTEDMIYTCHSWFLCYKLKLLSFKLAREHQGMKWNFKSIMAASISVSALMKTVYARRSVAIFHSNFLVPSTLGSGPLFYQYISF